MAGVIFKYWYDLVEDIDKIRVLTFVEWKRTKRWRRRWYMHVTPSAPGDPRAG